MNKKIYNPGQDFENELLRKETTFSCFEDFKGNPEIIELMNLFIEKLKKENKNLKEWNDWLYGFFYEEILKKNEISFYEKSFLYFYYIFKSLIEKLKNKENYEKIVVDLKYIVPLENYWRNYEEKIKIIFENFVYNEYYFIEMDVEFINEDCLEKAINEN